jgi:hypothetical protein
MILRRIDVARDPTDISTERFQRLDQHGGLNGHVKGTRNARAFQRLCLAVFLAGGHQARHFDLGNGDFFAAPLCEGDVFDDVIGELGHNAVSFTGVTVAGRSQLRLVYRPALDVAQQDIKRCLCLEVLRRRYGILRREESANTYVLFRMPRHATR